MSPPLRAQQTTGSILGTVEDAQGAVVVGAQVTAHNSDTRMDRKFDLLAFMRFFAMIRASDNQ
jgi:hypothetical protein